MPLPTLTATESCEVGAMVSGRGLVEQEVFEAEEMARVRWDRPYEAGLMWRVWEGREVAKDAGEWPGGGLSIR